MAKQAHRKRKWKSGHVYRKKAKRTKTAEKIRKWIKNAVRKKEVKTVLGILAIALVATVIFLAGKMVLSKERKASDLLRGTYVYDLYTEYDFDGKGKGCMRLEEVEFPFVYEITGDKLQMKYEGNRIKDSTYRFALDGKTLTLHGEEGTVGGTYVLTRK